mmetsp:Transcript_28350/g.91734  ORF Transcript_28350/g.91734 Transcript_28350/m.91734 type:complete len:411 (+) Transcript_28350:138-1370(+)
MNLKDETTAREQMSFRSAARQEAHSQSDMMRIQANLGSIEEHIQNLQQSELLLDTIEDSDASESYDDFSATFIDLNNEMTSAQDRFETRVHASLEETEQELEDLDILIQDSLKKVELLETSLDQSSSLASSQKRSILRAHSPSSPSLLNLSCSPVRTQRRSPGSCSRLSTSFRRSKSVEEEEEDAKTMKQRLEVFYKKVNPSKVVQVPGVLARFEGRQESLKALLRYKYGRNLPILSSKNWMSAEQVEAVKTQLVLNYSRFWLGEHPADGRPWGLEGRQGHSPRRGVAKSAGGGGESRSSPQLLHDRATRDSSLGQEEVRATPRYAASRELDVGCWPPRKVHEFLWQQLGPECVQPGTLHALYKQELDGSGLIRLGAQDLHEMGIRGRLERDNLISVANQLRKNLGIGDL